MVLTENLLHFIWQFRLFDPLNLRSTDGESLWIEEVGQHNKDAGPDFEFARVRINDALWSGQVEIHVNEGEWLRHKHHHDKRYDGTILHVVWERSSGKKIVRSDNTAIPTLVLKDSVDPMMIARYTEMMDNLYWIPCEQQINGTATITIQSWLSRMSVERLEMKSTAVFQWLDTTNNDWERVFMIILGRSFGMKVNAYVFEELCSKLDLSLLHRYKDDPQKIESMLFGQAGLLSEEGDDYSKSLYNEYVYLHGIHHFEGIERESWRFLRMRPYNFPTYRLGQLAALLYHRSYWFAYIQEVENIKDVFAGIDDSIINPYWRHHYRFDTVTKEHSASWSMSFKIHLVINCFIPMLFAYGMYMKEDKYKNKALDWLQELPAERNQITERFKLCGLECENAADSQGLLHLKHQYCTFKKCLKCAIGLAILKS